MKNLIIGFAAGLLTYHFLIVNDDARETAITKLNEAADKLKETAKKMEEQMDDKSTDTPGETPPPPVQPTPFP